MVLLILFVNGPSTVLTKISTVFLDVALCSLVEIHRCFGGMSSLYNHGKAVPLQAWTGPQGSRRLRPPNFLTIGTWSLTHRPPLPPGLSWYLLLEAELTPGTWNCQMSREKSLATRGIDPGTIRLIAQCLNHNATPGPPIIIVVQG